MSIHVIFEDNHLLAVAKPAGLPTQGAAAGRPSVVTQAKAYLRRKYRKPGNVYLGVVSRLDSAVSGVVLLARTSKAAARLNEQFRSRTVEKVYWALVEGKIEPAQGQCIDWIAKDESQQRMVVVSPPKAGTAGKKSADVAQEARLSYRRLKLVGNRSLLEIKLETGRKHQIRLQLSSRGHPIIGDKKYGSREKFPDGIALHCRRVVVKHPVKKIPVELEAPPPKAWKMVER